VNYEVIATWSQVISAILFLAVMIWLWIKFIQPAVLAAQEAHNRQIAEAERHRDEAKSALEALRSEINGAGRDAGAIRQRATDQATREREAAVAEATSAGDRAVRSAQGELDRARAAAREQLRTELLDKALVLAREEAETRVDAKLNAQLIVRFVSSLERRAQN
jgi:F0F1-type ATP synthase membrane subunit b/b'